MSSNDSVEEPVSAKPPRIEPLPPAQYTQEGLDVLAALRNMVSMPASDEVPEFNATMFRHPDLMRRQAELSMLFYQGGLSVRECELVILRTSWLCQAPYMFGLHVQIAKGTAGLTSDDIDRVKLGSAAPGWAEHDGAILRAVEELHANAVVSEETWTVLARKFDERLLLELPVMVGHYTGVAYLQNSVRFRLAPGNFGLASR